MKPETKGTIKTVLAVIGGIAVVGWILGGMVLVAAAFRKAED